MSPTEIAQIGIVSLNDFARLAEQEIARKNRDLSAQEVTQTLAAVCAPRPTTTETAIA